MGGQQEKEELMLKQAIKLSLEEEKISKEFQEIMQVQQKNNTTTSSSYYDSSQNNTTSFILSEDVDFHNGDDFFSSSAFPFDRKMPASSSSNNCRSNDIRNDCSSTWNARFVIPASTTPNSISSMNKDKYLIAELD